MRTFLPSPVGEPDNAELGGREARPSVPYTATDVELVEAFKRGQIEAFGDLFDRHFRLVHRVAWRYLEDEGEAQDLVQEVFLRFAQTIGSFDPRRGSVRAWLLAIARSRSLDRRSYLVLRGFYDWAKLEVAELTPASTRHGPLAITAQLDLEMALAELTPLQRQTIELYSLEGLAFGEIAERLNKTKMATEQIYYRAIQKLRRHLTARRWPWKQRIS